MRIRLVTPEPPRAARGNSVTALRWARILRGLGHTVTLGADFGRHRCDVLVALHARRSHEAATRFRDRHPTRPLIVALTGTDLYRDLPDSLEAQRSLALADRLIVLQPDAKKHLPRRMRPKARVVYQSSTPPARPRQPDPEVFEVCVLANLRPVKDPLLTARAARRLPRTSRIRIVHIGEALDPDLEDQATAEAAANPRYRWLGRLPRWRALRRLAGCRVLSLTSRLEGGANAVSEAIVCRVPVLSTRISGSMGLLGVSYPGFVPIGETRPLTRMLRRVEEDPAFLRALTRRCEARRELFDPATEERAWSELLAEL